MSDDLMEGFAAMMDAGVLSPGQLRGMGMDPLMVMALGGGDFGGGHGFDEYFDDDNGFDGYGVPQHTGRGAGGRGQSNQARGSRGRGGYSSAAPGAKGPPMQRCEVCATTIAAANMPAHLAGKRHKQAVKQHEANAARGKQPRPGATPQPQPAAAPDGSGAPTSAATSTPPWHEGLSQEAALQFFVDAYRLRVEDAFTLNGTHRGIYKGNDKKVADADFDRFLKAAKKTAGLLPPWFDAALVKRAAKQHIYAAVEASILKEDYKGDVAALRSLADRVEGCLTLAKAQHSHHDDKGSANHNNTATTSSKGGRSGQPMWYDGRTKAQAIQFFIDAYRLRIEDSYTQHGAPRGIYGGDRHEADADFNGFLRSAGRAPQLLPPWWNAGEVRRAAKQHIYMAVEASDLKGNPEYGFLGVMALRTLADLVEGPLDPYGDDFDDDDDDDDEYGYGGGGGGSRDRNMAALAEAMAMMHGGGGGGFDIGDWDDDDEEEEEWDEDGVSGDDASEFNQDPTQMKPKGGGGTVEVLESSSDDDEQGEAAKPAAPAAMPTKPPTAATAPKEFIPHLHKPKRGAFSMTRGDVIKLGVPVYSASSDGELARLAQSRAAGDVRVLFLVGPECTSAGLAAFAARAPRLQHFENRDSQITRDGLVAMAAACPQLEVVGANGVGDLDRPAAEAIVAALPRLKLLDLRGTDLGARLRSPNAPPFDVKPSVLLEY